MRQKRYPKQIVCGYLHTITQNGYPPDTRQTTAHIRSMADMGFSAIELEGIGEANIDYLYRNREAIAQEIESAGCHVPIFCVVLPQLASEKAALQREALESFDKGCALAAHIGAEGVLDNGPILPLLKPAGAPVKRHYGHAGDLVPGLQWSSYYRSLVDTYRDACRIADRYGLDYHLHPCEGSLVKDTDSFLLFARDVDHVRLRFNFDTANQFYFHDHLAAGLLRTIDYISYIHISDNSGQRVEHLPPGEGRIDWPMFFETLAKAGYRGRFGIDVGGAESAVDDITAAYIRSADWLQAQLQPDSSIFQS